MPADWEKDRQTCIDLNPNWDYTLWTTESSRDFIATNYSWFLKTYDNYRYPVQRTDTIRYFLLRHYGGIYIDLDNRCLTNLDPLLYYPTWTTDGARGALSNNILASTPNHPFWSLMTDSLIPYNYNYFLPYPTISYASGQWFHTAIWEEYHRRHHRRSTHRHGTKSNRPELGASEPLHRIMMDNRPNTPPWIFFTQERGGTWRNWDNAVFLWIGDHLVFLALLFCVGGVAIWRMTMRCYRRWSRKYYYFELNRAKDLEIL
ncbi:MAG: hypothetical protein Q9227_004502 [Pyrenula ochraceoflavens]